MAFPDYPGMAIGFAERVVKGREIACLSLKAGAERFLRMLDRAEKGSFAKDETFFWWSPDDLVDVCSFEEKISHVHGHSGALLLEPWQVFGNALIWGFRRESGARLTRMAYEWVPRGAGKSFRAATRALYCMTCEGENGPLGFICGAKDEHAQKVYGPLKAICDSDEDLRSHFDIETTLQQIRFGRSGKVQRVTEVPNMDEGHNPHIVVMEELHKQQGGLFRVMRSSLGKRMNSLFLCISTAGGRAAGVGWDNWRYCEDVLSGKHKLDHVSVLMFAADPGDEERYDAPEVIMKVMPHLGVSVERDAVMEEAREARAKPIERNEFLRTRLNIWTKAAGNLVDPVLWDRCGGMWRKREQFKGQTCFMALDLASRNDLAARTLMFEVGPRVVAFTKYYICEEAPAFENEDVAELYAMWRKEGWLRVTPGGYIDFNEILADTLAEAEEYGPEAIVVDDYQANQFIASLHEARQPAMAIKKTARDATEPTDDLLAMIASGLFEHDDNPITRWCAMNVIAYRDENGNILPKRDKSQLHLKIDGFETLWMANAARVSADRPKRRRKSVYEERGLRGFESA